MSKHTPSRVALFGGSFNPPHICHSLATLWVLQTQLVDEVWWVPTFCHAFDKDLVDFDTRLEMCTIAVAEFQHVHVHHIEKILGGQSRTIDTVRALQQRYEHTDFSLVVGADILEETHRWKNWDGLMEIVDLIVVGRRSYDEFHRLQRFDLELPDISSTIIRNALAQRDYDSISAWIPHRVLDFIATRQLYTEKKDPL